MAGQTFIVLVLSIGAFIVGVHGVRGALEIREALRLAEFDRLTSPPSWLAVRAFAGLLPAFSAGYLLASAGIVAFAVAAALAATGFALAPQLLLAARRRVERQVLDELPLHLDLLALAMEAGATWSSALATCRERAPDGPLRRAWERVWLDIQAGAEPIDALRGLEQRVRLRPFSTLVSSIRAAEKLQQPVAGVLRDRARQAAAGKFARAERAARVAPLRLWAAMLLCLAPCTALVLAWPMSGLLARVFG